MKQLMALMSLAVLLLQAQSWDVEVCNIGAERFGEIVSCELEAEQAKNGVAVKEILPNGEMGPAETLPVEINGGKARVYWRMTGITAPRAVRNYRLTAAKAPQKPVPPETDLQCKLTDGFINISNAYFSLRHPVQGRGGFPQDIQFKCTGYTDSRLFFYDRLVDQKMSQYWAKEDRKATAAVVYASPYCVIVEARTTYCKDLGPCPDGLHAIYRYVYLAGAPVVDVTLEVLRDDSKKPVAWREVQALHLSRQEAYYDAFVTGDEPQAHPLQAKGQRSTGWGGKDWAVMQSAGEAVGLGGGKAFCWDASNEYVYYVKRDRGGMSAEQKRVEVTGRLYFGPSSADYGWYSRWLNKNTQPQVKVRAASAEPQTVASKQPAKVVPPEPGACALTLPGCQLEFGTAAQGFPVVGLTDKQTGVRFFRSHEKFAGLWSLTFGPADTKKQLTLNSSELAPGTCEAKPEELTFRWKGLSLGEEKDVLDVTCTVRWEEEREGFAFRIDVANRSKVYGLRSSQYPRLPQVFEPGSGDVMVPGGNAGGFLWRNNRRNFSAPYPSGRVPMQFFAFNLGNTGVYVGAEDDAARAKQLDLTNGQDVAFTVHAENMGVPGAAKAMAFPVVVSLYHGDWWQAAKLYRRWALKQAWTAKGPLLTRADYPKQLCDNGLWMCLGASPAMMEKLMTQVQERVAGRTPVGVHWYTWHKIPFDHSYPEYFPPKEGFADTTAKLKAMGQLVMPYINGRLWDSEIDSFKARGIQSACKQETGGYYVEIYGSKRKLSPNCPSTELWQKTVQNICHRLMTECGVNAIYLDQIGAARPVLCFDKTHGHPLGGGRHWVDGYRELLTPIKAEATKLGVALTTEDVAEPYMDTIDGWLTWRPRLQSDVPALMAVYGGYTTYFSSPQSKDDTLTSFRLAQGRDFLWGIQLGWNDIWILKNEHKEYFKVLLDLAALQKSAKEFMVYGELLGDVRSTEPVPSVNVVWRRNQPHEATLPAVQAVLWRGSGAKADDLLLAVVNATDVPQPFNVSGAALRELGKWQGGTVFRTRLTENGEELLAQTAEMVDLPLVLWPGEARLVAFRHQAPPKAAPKATDRWLTQAAGECTYRAAGGPEVRLQSYAVSVVEGEKPMLRLSADGGKAVELKVTCGGETAVVKVGEEPVSCEIPFDPAVVDGDDKSTLLALRVEQPGRQGYLEMPVVVRLVPPLELQLGSVPEVRGGDSFVLPVSVTNHSRLFKSGRVLLTLPAGWQAEPASSWSFDRLEPYGVNQRLLKVTVPADAKAGSQGIDASLVLSGSRKTLKVLKARPTLRAYRMIDSHRDTAVLAPEVPECIRIEKDYGGADDLSATVFCNWDMESLRIHASVKDNVHSQKPCASTVWSGDCLQFAICTGAMNTKPGYNGEEVEFAVAWTPEQGGYVFLWTGEGSGKQMTSAKVSVKREGTMTTYDAQIPWRELGIGKPAKGTRFPFSFTVNDNDGDVFRGWLQWTPGICGGKDSSAFGWLILE